MLVKPVTIADSVYEQIRHDIIHLHLAPGERLSEASLAERYQVGRAPIRVALRRLNEDGMIDIRPQSGSIVSPISFERALSIIDVRLILEPYCVRLAIPRITEEEIAYLEERFLYLDQLAEQGSPDYSQKVSEVDIELHHLLQTKSGNIIIPEIINRYAGEIQRIRRANSKWKNRTPASAREMRAIFEAVKRRDTEAAMEAMASHLGNTRKALLQLSQEADAQVQADGKR